MRVFLDTNVLLDAIVVRSDAGLTDNAATILSLGETSVVDLYMSVLSVPTIAYVLKNVSSETKKLIIRNLTEIVSVLPSRDDHVMNMLDGTMSDIEDALQVQSALEGSCDLIITRNCKDYFSCPIPVMRPDEFLERVIYRD